MKASRLRRWVLVGALLTAGALVSQVWPQVADARRLVPASAAPVLRPFDLLVQLGLMLVCALGIRALLPGDDELEGDDG